jgi:hypothetical protein
MLNHHELDAQSGEVKEKAKTESPLQLLHLLIQQPVQEKYQKKVLNQ